MDNGVSISTVLEPTIYYLTKEKILCRMSEYNLVRRGNNIRAEIALMEKSTLKAMRGYSRYNTIPKRFKKENIKRILFHTNVKTSCVSSDVFTVFNAESDIR